MSKLFGIPIESLGRPALLQLQAQGHDVKKYLDRPPKSVLPKGLLPQQHKFGVFSAKDARTMDGIVFASKLELNAYRYLRDQHIPFDRQVPFVLEENFEFEGKKYRAFKYVTDFVLEPQGKRLVVDTKGFETPMFKLQKKLMVLKHGIHIHCVRSLTELALLIREHGLLVGVNEHSS